MYGSYVCSKKIIYPSNTFQPNAAKNREIGYLLTYIDLTENAIIEANNDLPIQSPPGLENFRQGN